MTNGSKKWAPKNGKMGANRRQKLLENKFPAKSVKFTHSQGFLMHNCINENSFRKLISIYFTESVENLQIQGF